jgi:hypothetical protein
VSISPTFHGAAFVPKSYCQKITNPNFWQKDFGAKAAHKMLVKLKPGVLRPQSEMFYYSRQGQTL